MSPVEFLYSSSQKYIPIGLLTVIISERPRMIPFSSESCLRKLERVKANSIEPFKIMGNYHTPAV
jgi:hypothetical protein